MTFRAARSDDVGSAGRTRRDHRYDATRLSVVTEGGSRSSEQSPGQAAESGSPSAQQRALAVIGTVVAPIGLVTALMYLFGLLHAYWFFSRFGVEYTLMGLTTQDYLVRSADGLFVPLVVVAFVGLAVLWTSRCLPTTLLTRVRRTGGRLAAVASTVGAAGLLAIAAAGIADPALFAGSVGVPGLSLTCAVLLLTAASRSRGRSRHGPAPVLVAEWIAIFLLVGAGLYWAVTDYSASVGTKRADQLIAALPSWPDAVVYSEKSISLALPGVHERRCQDAEGAYAFRYDGLKLVLESGGQLFLLPAQWADGTGAAIVLPRTDALRLEFTAPGCPRKAAVESTTTGTGGSQTTVDGAPAGPTGGRWRRCAVTGREAGGSRGIRS